MAPCRVVVRGESVLEYDSAENSVGKGDGTFHIPLSFPSRRPSHSEFSGQYCVGGFCSPSDPHKCAFVRVLLRRAADIFPQGAVSRAHPAHGGAMYSVRHGALGGPDRGISESIETRHSAREVLETASCAEQQPRKAACNAATRRPGRRQLSSSTSYHWHPFSDIYFSTFQNTEISHLH